MSSTLTAEEWPAAGQFVPVGWEDEPAYAVVSGHVDDFTALEQARRYLEWDAETAGLGSEDVADAVARYCFVVRGYAAWVEEPCGDWDAVLRIYRRPMPNTHPVTVVHQRYREVWDG